MNLTMQKLWRAQPDPAMGLVNCERDAVEVPWLRCRWIFFTLEVGFGLPCKALSANVSPKP